MSHTFLLLVIVVYVVAPRVHTSHTDETSLGCSCSFFL